MLWHKLMGAQSSQLTPIAYLSHTATDSADAETVIAAKPSGVQSGDLLIAYHYCHISDGLNTSVSGWTTLRSAFTASGYFRVFYKLAGESEPTTYSFDGGGANQGVVIVAFRGGSASVGVFGTVASAASTSVTATGITPSTESMLLFFSAAEFTPQYVTDNPSGMTKVFEQNTTPVVAFYTQQVSAGATGNKSITWAVSAGNVAVLMSIY